MSKAIKAIAGAGVVFGLCLPVNAVAKDDLQAQVDKLGKQVAELQKQLNNAAPKKKVTTKKGKKVAARKRRKAENFTDAYGENNFHAVAVTTSPTLGIRSAHHGQDLVVNFSSLNEDLRLLEQRKKYQAQRGLPELSRPLIELSGVLRGDILYSEDFNGSSTTDLDLEQAELDVFIEASRWVSGFMSISYDNGYAPYSWQAMSVGSPYNSTSWSNLYLKRGFITVGDLTQSPIYGSIGQMYMPFGKYSSWLVSSSLTKKLGRTSGRGIDLGYAGDDFVATGFVMHSDSKEVNETTPNTGNTNNINAWGANVEKKLALGKDNKLTLGAGYTSNIADSEGVVSLLEYATLSTGGTLTYDVQSYVPAYDIYAKLELGSNWIINAEYINATKDIISSLSPALNLGQPKAYHLELDHLTFLGPLPLAMGLGYGHTDDFVYFPRDSYQLALSTYIWKDTVQSLEFRHLKKYDGTSNQVGFSENYVTALFSMYF
ncbi:MAG: LbtU family siderophore porin [Pseudomonadota bacterium]|nr:LbtU family siderophore porin [Pseudomonadota bacterium]